MEIEKKQGKTQEKVVVFCSDDEKRKIWAERVAEFLEWNNRLCQRIDRQVEIKIDQADLDRLLDRIMQEDTLDDIRLLMNGLVISNDSNYAHKLASYEMEMKNWGNRVEKKGETADEKKMRLAAIEEEKGKPNPIVEVFFNRFDLSLSGNDEWVEYYDKYNEFLLLGNQNKLRLKDALINKSLLDVTFTTYKSEIIRFNILEPFAKCKVGMKLPKPE